MKKEFWINKWQTQQIGFHKDFVHPLLKKYISTANLNQDDTVFVPLCGKSNDMLWLEAQGYEVIGVEISQLAVEQFFEENQRDYTIEKNDHFARYQSGKINIFLGDVFALSAKDLKSVKCVYDRAALIALPEEMAEKYTQHLYQVLPAKTSYLLISLEMDRVGGPPFSLVEKRIQQLFKSYRSCKLERKKDILDREPKFQDEGCSFMYEKVHWIQT